MNNAQTEPAITLAGDGLILWGSLVGGGYAVGALRTLGVINLTPLIEIAYWSSIVVIGWSGSILLGIRARRFSHASLPPAALATMIALPGGITFTLYFALALLAGTFDPFTMWAVAAAQFSAWTFGLGGLIRRPWLVWFGFCWFMIFAVGTVLGAGNRWLEAIMAASCLLLLILPGLILLTRERQLLASHLDSLTKGHFCDDAT
jgi:hypothetical protein